jgi:hypothetical protein
VSGDFFNTVNPRYFRADDHKPVWRRFRRSSDNGLFGKDGLEHAQIVAAENQCDLFFFVAMSLEAVN